MALNRTKERRQLLASDIRRSQTEAALALKELLNLLISDVKDSLVAAEGIELTRLQGEARALDKLLTTVTKEPSSIKRPEGD
jgi:hypothetical protein